MGARDPAYLQRVRELGCVFCSQVLGIPDTPAAAHHAFDPSQRDDYLTIALCHTHHQGPQGFHGLGGEKPFRARYGVGEVEMLAWTLAGLNRGC